MKRSFFSRFPEYQVSYEEGIRKFLNRINELIYSDIEKSYGYDNFFKNTCSILGYKSQNYTHISYGVGNNYEGLEYLTNRDLGRTLELLEHLPEKYHEDIKNLITLSKNKDNVDLGIRFHNGLFYKAGDEELDELIINNSIDNIFPYEKARNHYLDALKYYSSGNYSEALTNCYTTIEKLAKELLGNDKVLENNRDDLMKFLKDGNEDGFVKNWREIIKNLCSYLHDFSTRHGSKIEEINEIEVDATIYLTGTIINLLSKKNKLNSMK